MIWLHLAIVLVALAFCAGILVAIGMAFLLWLDRTPTGLDGQYRTDVKEKK